MTNDFTLHLGLQYKKQVRINLELSRIMATECLKYFIFTLSFNIITILLKWLHTILKTHYCNTNPGRETKTYTL